MRGWIPWDADDDEPIFDLAPWVKDAACRREPSDIFFPRSRHAEKAKAICAKCPVRIDCLERAMRFERGHGISYRVGIFGGLTASERHRLAKERRVGGGG